MTVPSHVLQRVVLPSVDDELFSVRESLRRVRYTIGYEGKTYPAVSAHHASDIVQRLVAAQFSPWDVYNHFSKTKNSHRLKQRIPTGLVLEKVGA